MKTDPLRIGNLTLDAALESDEAIGLIKAEDLADPYADQTLAALGHLGSYSHVALLTYPGTPEQPVPDRLLLPLNPTGYGPACFLRATGYGGYRLGRPRALNDRTTSAIVAAATDLLGWPRLAPPKPAAATRKKKKEFKPDDRGRRDLPIYLTILTEAGEPVPSEAEIAATPLCELLRTLHARVIQKGPYRLIDLIANGRNGPLAKHVRSQQFRACFPSTKIRWSGGEMLPPEDGSDSSAYRNLVADVYDYLVKGRDGEANWLELFDPAAGGVVGWVNDKVRRVALRKLNDPKDGARIYTPDHEAYDADPNAAALTPDTALAFGPATFDATEANQDGAIARIRNYLGRLHEFPMRERRQTLDALGTLVEEYYRFDDRTKAELGAELAAARARHLRIEAVAEGSAHLGPNLTPRARENLRAAKAKLALHRPKFAAHDFSNDAVDPYAAPVPETVFAAKSAEFWERLNRKTAEVWEKTRQTLRETRPKRRNRKADPNQFLLFPEPAEPARSEAPKARPAAPAEPKAEPAAAVEPPNPAPKPASRRRGKAPDPNQLWLPLGPLPDAKPTAVPEPAPPCPVGTLIQFLNSQSARLEWRDSPAAVRRPRVRDPDPAGSRVRAPALV